MRFTILSFLIICFSYNVKSQNDSIVQRNTTSRATGLKAGTIFVGASSNFSVSKDSPVNGTDNSYSTISFSPKSGVFIAKRLLFGTEYQLIRTKSSIPIFRNSSLEIVNNEHVVSVFARYYFGSWKLKPFIEASGGIGVNKNTRKEDANGTGFVTEDETKNDIKVWKLSAGLSYFITKRISLDGIVSFGETKQVNFYTNQFVRANFGFSLFF